MESILQRPHPIRLLLLIFLVVHSVATVGQTVVFKVITFSEGVMIDKRPATLGMDVNTWHKNVFIPRGGHLGVITYQGFPYIILESVPVGSVGERAEEVHNRFVNRSWHRDMRPHDWLEMSLAVGTTSHPDVRISSSEMIGDSLFMYWTTWNPYGTGARKMVKADYEFMISDEQDQELLTRYVSSNWVLLKLPPRDEIQEVYRTNTFYFGVRSERPMQACEPMKLTLATRHRTMDALYLLDEIPRDENRYFFQCAMYQLLDLRLDMHLPVYHILKEKRKSTDPVFQKYFEVLSVDYHFDLIGF